MPRRPQSTTICARIDDALTRAAARQLKVRAIYLDGTDLLALGRARRGRVGDYLGHQVRVGASSKIYSTHGVGLNIAPRARPPAR